MLLLSLSLCSNANIDLKFETDDVDGGKTQGDPESGLSGIPPTFTEKPKIVPNEKGTLVTLKFKIKADPKPEIQWFKVKIVCQEFHIFEKLKYKKFSLQKKFF